MQLSRWLLCLWPGLARLWTKGDWSSLYLAVGYSVLFNLALISSLIWPELLGQGFPTVIWPVLAGVWIVSALIAHHQFQRTDKKSGVNAMETSPVPDTLFIQAQREYLKGHWDEATLLLRRRLQFRERDVESRLLLATLYRHRRNWDAAKQELETLRRFDESVPWRLEIDAEFGLIVESMESSEPAEEETVQELRDSRLERKVSEEIQLNSLADRRETIREKRAA